MVEVTRLRPRSLSLTVSSSDTEEGFHLRLSPSRFRVTLTRTVPVSSVPLRTFRRDRSTPSVPTDGGGSCRRNTGHRYVLGWTSDSLEVVTYFLRSGSPVVMGDPTSFWYRPTQDSAQDIFIVFPGLLAPPSPLVPPRSRLSPFLTRGEGLPRKGRGVGRTILLSLLSLWTSAFVFRSGF